MSQRSEDAREIKAIVQSEDIIYDDDGTIWNCDGVCF